MAKTKRVHRLDLTSQRFGRWTVISKVAEKNFRGEIRWNCVCDCGTQKTVLAGSLRKQISVSCGCYSADRTRKHGMEGTATYNCWANLLTRCRNVHNRQYNDYGGRGISVCERWHSFENFLADMGEKPEGFSIDRINNDGDYEPGNCRWASYRQQINNRRNTPMVMYQGETMAVSFLADKVGIRRKLLLDRIRRGLSIEDAISPIRSGRYGQTSKAVK